MDAGFSLFINIIFFAFIYISSRKLAFTSVFLLISLTLFNLFLADNNFLSLIKKMEINSKNIHDSIIFNLDHCAKFISLDACRLLYNKPIFVLNEIFMRILVQFSQENILSFLRIPLRPILIIFCYIGIFNLFSNKKTAFVFQLWIIIYGLMGIFGSYNPSFSSGYSVFLVFLTIQGIISFLNKIKIKYV